MANVSNARNCRDKGIKTIYSLTRLLPKVIRGNSTGAPRKNLLKRTVMSESTVIALKGKHLELLKDVSIRTIQHRL